MKRLVVSLFIISVVFNIHSLNAQSAKKTIQGKVISFEESFPLEGVSVAVKGTGNATGTQVDGTYSLEIKPGDSILVFTQSGYETQEIKIDPRQKEYNIVLKSNTGVSDHTITSFRKK